MAWVWLPKKNQNKTTKKHEKKTQHQNKQKPKNSTKRRVNRNIPQNRLGRTPKPHTNLLQCFKASSVHPPPSPLSGFPPSPPCYEAVLRRWGLDGGQADGCSIGSPAASCVLRNGGCTCPCPSSHRRGSALVCAARVLSCPPDGLPCEQSQPKIRGGGRGARRWGMLAGGAWRADPPHS